MEPLAIMAWMAAATGGGAAVYGVASVANKLLHPAGEAPSLFRLFVQKYPLVGRDGKTYSREQAKGLVEQVQGLVERGWKVGKSYNARQLDEDLRRGNLEPGENGTFTLHVTIPQQGFRPVEYSTGTSLRWEHWDIVRPIEVTALDFTPPAKAVKASVETDRGAGERVRSAGQRLQPQKSRSVGTGTGRARTRRGRKAPAIAVGKDGANTLQL